MKLKGRAGAYSFYSINGRQVARVAQNSTNYGETARRSPAQQARRVLWANPVQFYKVSSSWMRGAFETKKANESDYNAFMRKNLASARIALTKDQAAQGVCVLDEFLVSEGTLQSVVTGRNSANIETRLQASERPEDDMTIARFSEIIIAENAGMSEGMQLSFVVYGTWFDEQGWPFVSCAKHELTLNRSDSRTLGTILPNFSYSSGTQGLIFSLPYSDDSYMALIVSDSTSGKLRVSTERLMKGDDDPAITFSSEEQRALAAQSYGVDPSYFLESGDGREEPLAPVQRILSATINGKRVEPGKVVTISSEDELQSLRITFALNIPAGGDLEVDDDDISVEMTTSQYSAGMNYIELNAAGVQAWNDATSGNFELPNFISYVVGGTTYSIEFVLARS